MTQEATQRAAVASEAMQWIGTPYHHHARVRGAGVDCAQLLIAVYSDVGVIPEAIEPGHYAHDWHLHHSEETFIGWVQGAGAVRTETPQAGDVALFRYGRCFSHGAILIAPDRVVHSYLGLGVCAHYLHEAPLAGRVVQFWNPWGAK